MGLERPNTGADHRDCEIMEEEMGEFLASIFGIGVLAISIGMFRHYLKQREWEKRIKSIVDRYELINK